MRARDLLWLLVIASLVGAPACSDDDSDDSTDTSQDTTPSDDADDAADAAPWEADADCDVVLDPSMEETAVRSAFLEVTSGQVLCFAPGVYAFTRELSLTIDDVEVRGAGMGETVLDFADQTSGANGVFVRADDFTIRHLTIKNSPGDALRVEGTVERFAQRITFSYVETTWDGGPSADNGAYGFYPVLTEDVLIEHCEASNASDAGIYVGQSRRVVVRDSLAHGNVAGIEVENTVDADVFNNVARGNTGGVLIFDLPDKPIQGGRWAKVHHNVIEVNNEPNFAPRGNIVANVPTGTGVIVLASDENEIHDNTITGNGTVGVVVTSYFLVDPNYAPDCADEEDNDDDGLTDAEDPDCAGERDDSEEAGKADYDPYPERNHIHDNVLVDNGESPTTVGLISIILQNIGLETVEQLVWDGYINPDATDPNNCWNNNVDDTGAPASWRTIDASGGFADSHTDLSRDGHDCVGLTLDAVDLGR